jgi:hypothetical protein
MTWVAGHLRTPACQRAKSVRTAGKGTKYRHVTIHYGPICRRQPRIVIPLLGHVPGVRDQNDYD